MALRTTNLDRWFWRKLGRHGTVIFNLALLLGFFAVIAAICVRKS